MQNQQKTQEIQKEIGERFISWQKSAKYPKALYPKYPLEDLVKKSFVYFTPAQLKIPIEDYTELFETKYKDYDLRQISFILQMLENLTANDFGISIESYIEMQTEVKKMIVGWQNIIQPKNKELTEEGQERIRIHQEEEQQAMNDKINADLKEQKGRTIEMPVGQA
jgi:hypothetical protein